MIQIYHNPRCRKSREALSLLENTDEVIEVIEYLKQVPSKEELKSLLDKLGLKPNEIIRKTEPVFKEEYKGKSLTDEQWIEAMVAHPKLIERPIVVKGEKAVIGRPLENVEALLG